MLEADELSECVDVTLGLRRARLKCNGLMDTPLRVRSGLASLRGGLLSCLAGLDGGGLTPGPSAEAAVAVERFLKLSGMDDRCSPSSSDLLFSRLGVLLRVVRGDDCSSDDEGA